MMKQRMMKVSRAVGLVLGVANPAVAGFPRNPRNEVRA
jgi:hypothetical protein